MGISADNKYISVYPGLIGNSGDHHIIKLIDILDLKPFTYLLHCPPDRYIKGLYPIRLHHGTLYFDVRGNKYIPSSRLIGYVDNLSIPSDKPIVVIIGLYTTEEIENYISTLDEPILVSRYIGGMTYIYRDSNKSLINNKKYKKLEWKTIKNYMMRSCHCCLVSRLR